MKIKGTCHVALDATTSDKLIASENIPVESKTLSNVVVIVVTNYVISNESDTCNTLEYKTRSDYKY